jgi:hypothetical protein
MREVTFIILFIILGLGALAAFAANDSGLPNPLGSVSTVADLLEKIVRFLRDIASPIVAGMVIYGAFQIMTAGGDTDRFTQGKKTILWAIIGYAIIWIGWGIALIIQDVLS